MQKFDSAFAADVIERLGRLEPDAKPAWGRMKAEELIPHLLGTMQFSVGEGPNIPYGGNWVTENIVGPLLLNGILPMPKNVKFKDEEGEAAPALSSPGTLEDLKASMDEYISKAGGGGLATSWHTVFGDIGANGWAKMHVVHFRHHLKQFGI